MVMVTELYDDKLIVITGAAGFIGSGVVRYLNNKGYTNLLLVDDFGKTQKWKNLRHKKFIEFISRHELFDFLDGREENIESFVHLGAHSSTVEVNADVFMEMNYRYSIRLAEYALKHNHRFIYASSAATYGDGSLGFSDSEDQLDHLCPLNVYGFSKHMFDKWLQERGVLDKVVGLKYFNIYGPNEYEKGRMASMVMHMTHQIQKIGKVLLFKSSDPEKFKDGEQCRDFFYVKDAVKMTCFFLDHDLNGIFNVGIGEANTWNKMAKLIFEFLGKRPNIEYISMPKDLVGKYQDYTCAEMNKFYSGIKQNNWVYKNDFSFESGLKDYVSNYLLKGARW